MSTYYIFPSERDIQHHGVLGMKWGVRNYQSYNEAPRKSGKSGVEKISARDIRKANSKLKKYAKAYSKNIKALKYASKGYKTSINRGNSDGNNNAYMDKAKKYKEQANKIKLKSSVTAKDLQLASPKAVIKYEKGIAKMKKVSKKYNSIKLSYNTKFNNTAEIQKLREYIDF